MYKSIVVTDPNLKCARCGVAMKHHMRNTCTSHDFEIKTNDGNTYIGIPPTEDPAESILTHRKNLIPYTPDK
jgi:hypothetical protein